MSAKYLTVCDQQYNKKQFSEKWARIVNGYELGVTISPGDTAFLVDVLGRIPRFAKILAKGRVIFRVIQRTFNGKRVKGIALVTPNSNYEVWAGKQSVIDSVFPKSSPHNPGKENRKNVLRALRAIIEPQIKEYRKRFAGKSVIKSSLSGKPIFGPYHVDHVYPFIRLVEEWCREKSYDLETIPVKCRGATCKLQSVEMAESWFDYHAFHAEFQVLDASENVSKGSRYYGRGK
ncbi:hypothetical protein EBT25_11255 [bacterium]|nr:hypothetical protein [bacterium]